MTFPTITHIDDLLPHIEGRDDFEVVHKDGFSLIDYRFTLPDSFDDPMRLECRGIKFGPDGRILARPLAKFFNVNERPETQAHLLDFSTATHITEKRDGTMIHPAIIDGEVVFMTRGGRTEHALRAERHLTYKLKSACMHALLSGSTPIFEWTAPDNRIVIRYDESRLTLLAVRDTECGWYTKNLHQWASLLGVSAVAHHDPLHEWPGGFLEYVRALKGMEGFVIRFPSGLWVKAKAEDYVLKHKAKEAILLEKNVLALVMNDAVDDVLPLLDEKDRDAVVMYARDVRTGLTGAARVVGGFVQAHEDTSQKDFAVECVPTLPEEMRSLAFRIRAGADPHEAVRDAVLKNLGSQTKVDAIRGLHGAQWEYGA